MASRGGHSGNSDSFCNATKRHDSNKENTSQQGLNAFRMQKERQTEWARPGRVFNRNISRGGYSRSQHGFTQEFRIVKDNRSKQKEAGEALPEASHNRDSSNEHSVSNVGDESSTEKLAAQHHLVTPNVNGHGAAQADKGIKSAAQAHDKEVKPFSVRKLEQSEGMQATLVGSHEVLGKGNQNRVATVSSGKNNFGGELCCSSSDPIHVPSPGSKSAGTFGAIKREVGVVGARQRPSESAATNIPTSNSLAKVTSTPKDNPQNKQQSELPGASLRNGRFNASHTKVSPHLEWKPKSMSPSCVNHDVSVVPPGVDGNHADLSGLSKKLSQANVSQDEHVIIPEHIRVPDFERTHLIFGTFESEIDPMASVTASHNIVTKEDLNEHSPSSLIALNSIISTDVAPNDKTDHVGSCSPLPQPESVVSVSEHQQSLTESVEDPSTVVVGEYGTNEMISSKVTHSQPQLQHQDNPAVQNFKAYEPDSRYVMPFITKIVDSETAQNTAYTSEAMGLHPANAYQLPATGAAQPPVPQMYPQQFQVQQYPNFLPYRHVYSAQYGSPMVIPNYSSNPAFPQLPHASSYLVMTNGASQLAANGMKYGPYESSHQYKQVFQGTPAGYGGYANHNGYPISNGVIGSTGAIEDANMNKYKDNSLYAPNPQAETADLWVQGQREIPNMPPAPFYNMVGQPVSPHAAYLPPHNGHPSFSPAPPHPAHLQYSGFPHAMHPTSMTMVQNPQAMVHQPGAPPLAGNLGLDMATMAPGSQVGAFQQNQLGHLGWVPQSF